MEISFVMCLLSGHELILNREVLDLPITVALGLPATLWLLLKFWMGHSVGCWAPALSLPPSLAPSVMCRCLGPCFCWSCITVKGGLDSLTEEVLLMPLNVLYSAFHLHKIWGRFLTMISRGKESMVLYHHVLQALFTLLLLQRQERIDLKRWYSLEC